MKRVFDLLPDEHIRQLKQGNWSRIEEIRLCAEQPMLIRSAEGEHLLWPKISAVQVEDCLKKACRQSVYSFSETIRRGYITMEGGNRIGICGFGVWENDEIKTLKHPSSLLIRFARSILGYADHLVRVIDDSTLIIGPPCSGKTTLLRDLIRQLSNQPDNRIGLADERGELSATCLGIPQLDVGIRTDILVNVPKADAVLMLLRTMNPTWIAMDEITAPSDLHALERTSYCGVKLLATIHGQDLSSVMKRPLYRDILSGGMFRWVVEMKPNKQYEIREVPV